MAGARLYFLESTVVFLVRFRPEGRRDTCKSRYHVCFLVCSGGNTVKNV